MAFRAFRSRRSSAPPELQELERSLKDEEKALSAAEKERASRVKEIRKQLRDAERAHERAVAAAQAELSRRRKEQERRIAVSRKRYESIRTTLAPMEIARFGKTILYEDRIVTKQGEALLQRGVTAIADTAAKIAIARPGAVARLAASGAVDGRAFRTVQGYDARRFYLLLEAPELVALLSCRKADEQNARDFAARVNVAALNARRIGREREDTLAEAQHELDAAESQQEAVVAADNEVARLMADTEAIDLARTRLEEAEADTTTILTQRERISELEDEHAKAFAAEEARLAEDRQREEEERAQEERDRSSEETSDDSAESETSEKEEPAPGSDESPSSQESEAESNDADVLVGPDSNVRPASNGS